MSEGIWTVAISSAASILVAWLTVWAAMKLTPAQIKKTNADATEIAVGAAASLVEPLKKRVDELEADLGEACGQYDKLREDHQQLRTKYEQLEREKARLVEQVQVLADALERERQNATELRQLYEQMQAQYEELQSENRLLADWSERLAHQVQALGGVPVEMRKPAARAAKK